MKYTYQISFNGSDYSDLSLTDVQMSGEWITGTKIWRENISDLKITKTENSSIYDTLETWFTDSSKFTTRIFVKIYKNSVEDSTHWFGIKWGKINRETKTYEVQPLAYDYWSQYFESAIEETTKTVSSITNYHYHNITQPYTYLGRINNAAILEEVIKDMVTDISDWSSSNIVSTILFGDSNESGTAVSTYRGIDVDYVTGEQSLLIGSGLVSLRGNTFNDILQALQSIRVFCFFDSNNKFRFEHIKFFNDKLTSNAVDYSAYIEDYDDVWSYENTLIPVVENIKFSNDTVDDDDFGQKTITYSSIKNRPDTQFADYNFNIKTYLGTSAGNLSDNLIFLGSNKNTSYKFFNGDFSVLFSTDGNYLNINGGSSGQYCGSNDFTRSTTSTYALTVNVSSISGSFDIYLEERSSGTLFSNKATISTTGLQSFTLTPIAGTPNDLYLKIESTSIGATLECWVVLDAGSTYTVHNIQGAATGNVINNGALSVANVIDKYWRHDRLSINAFTNGSDYTAVDTQYNLRREDIRIHFSGVINPLYGFNDGTRIGMIEKWERDLDTDYYTISVIYQEDE